MRKGYKPKTSRLKLPLSVEAQRKLIEGCEDDRTRALVLLMLSTGMHPRVLSMKKYGLIWDATYFAWRRPKTNNPVQGLWSNAMREGETLDALRRVRGKSGVRYWQLVSEAGEAVGLKGLCPLQLRHTNFVNRARLGHNAFDIAMASATDLQTVYQHYMIGMGQAKSLSSDDRDFLQWLMEV